MRVKRLKYLLILSYVGLTLSLSGQHKFDYYWPFGGSPSREGSQLNFQKKQVESETRENVIFFDRTNASICDAEGNLLFYTNGCRVADSTHQIMPNGDSLNFNLFYTDWIFDCFSGYFEKQGITILPDPGNEQGYYIIHKPFEMILHPDGNIDFFHSNILYSYVDMQANGGLGAVIIKNDTVMHRQLFQSAHMTAINHANGKDWWILNPGDTETGNIYYRTLLDETGFAELDSQAIGPILIEDEWPQKATGGGLSRFSPDGTKYAYFNLWDGLHLYDFDRETGLLSNGTYLDFGWEANNNIWMSSIAFSPDSRFIYLINTFSLYQLDTWEENLMNSLSHIADRDTSVLSLFDGFHIMAAGPDCKIYIRSGSTTDNFSVIHSPNEKGMACDFRQADLKLAASTGAGNFPYFPKFRVDAEEKCDSTISMVNGVTVFWRRDLSFYPNPTSDQVTLELPSQRKGYLRLLDLEGHLMEERETFGFSTTEQIDMTAYPMGTYFVEYVPNPNPDRAVWTGKVVVVR